MSDMGKRIKQIREQRGLSLSALGRLAGGLAYQTIQDLEKGDSKGSKHLLAIAHALGVNPTWLQTGEGSKEVAPRSAQKPTPQPVDSNEDLTTRVINIQQWPRDVPILGGGACGEDGLFELNGQTLGFAKRPPGIMGAKDVYALYIWGDSMSPWREHGGLVYVHPRVPVKIMDYVVVELAPESGHPHGSAYIKRLVRRTADLLVLHQFKPDEDLKLPMKKVKAIHRIMDWDELVG